MILGTGVRKLKSSRVWVGVVLEIASGYVYLDFPFGFIVIPHLHPDSRYYYDLLVISYCQPFELDEQMRQSRKVEHVASSLASPAPSRRATRTTIPLVNPNLGPESTLQAR